MEVPYLVNLREEARADLLHVKVVQAVQRGDGVPERLTRRAGTPLRAWVLKRFAHVQPVHAAVHLRGSPRIATLFSFLVATRRRWPQFGRQVLRRRTRRAALLRRVVFNSRPVLGWCRGDEVTGAGVVLAGAGRTRGIAGAVLRVDCRSRWRLLMRAQVARDRSARRVIRRRRVRERFLVIGRFSTQWRVNHLGRPRGRKLYDRRSGECLRKLKLLLLMLFAIRRVSADSDDLLGSFRAIPRTWFNAEIASDRGSLQPPRPAGRGYRGSGKIRTILTGRVLLCGDRRRWSRRRLHVGIMIPAKLRLFFSRRLGRHSLWTGRDASSRLSPARSRNLYCGRWFHRSGWWLQDVARRLGDHRVADNIVFWPPRSGLVVAAHIWCLLRRETRQAWSCASRSRARLRRHSVRRTRCVRRRHLPEHLRRYCGEVAQADARQWQPCVHRITRGRLEAPLDGRRRRHGVFLQCTAPRSR